MSRDYESGPGSGGGGGGGSFSTSGATGHDEVGSGGSSASPNKSRKRLSGLRGAVRGAASEKNPDAADDADDDADDDAAPPAGFDAERFSGVVRFEFRGRLDCLNAVGTNVSKFVGDKGRGGRQVPGRIVRQSGPRTPGGKLSYTAIYLDGSSDVLDETYLRHHSALFSNATTSTYGNIKPIVVEMV